MDVIEIILSALTPVVLMGVTWVLGRAVPAGRDWFQRNADNAFVELLLKVVMTIVESLSQLDDVPNAAKRSTAIRTVVDRLEPQRKRLEAVTGAKLEAWADEAVEASVSKLKREK